jgi:hypothetical protein
VLGSVAEGLTGGAPGLTAGVAPRAGSGRRLWASSRGHPWKSNRCQGRGSRLSTSEDMSKIPSVHRQRREAGRDDRRT